MRTLLVFPLFIMAGAIVNVAVAWGCATISDWPEPGEKWTHWSTAAAWPNSVSAHWPAGPEVTRLHGALSTITRHIKAVYPESEKDLKYGHFMIDRYDFGWPLRTLGCELWWETGMPGTGSVGMQGTGSVGTYPEGNRGAWRPGFATNRKFNVIPLLPIWPGFAINTIFYAAMLWMLFAAPGYVRRRIRVRRGQCPACAYPVGASDVCTECGKPVTARSGEAVA